MTPHRCHSRLVSLSPALISARIHGFACIGRGRAWADATRLQRAASRGSMAARIVAPAARPCALASTAVQEPHSPYSSDSRLSITPGEVHIWWLHPAKVTSPAALQRYSALLSAEELHECGGASAATNPAIAKERLLARALVRSVLAQYVAGSPPPQALRFDRNQHGKPSLVWPSLTAQGHRLHFNLTHTTSLIGLAVTAGSLVGVDVEEVVRRARDPLRLARRRFADSEIEDLQGSPEGSPRDAHFIQLWTLKEAYVKAVGRGISAPPGLRSFAFRLGGIDMQQQPQGQQQQQQQQQQAAGCGSQHPAKQASSTPLLGGMQGQAESDDVGLEPGTPSQARDRGAAAAEDMLELAGFAAVGDSSQQDPGVGGASSSEASSSSSSIESSSSSSSNEGSIEFWRSREALEHEGRQWRFMLLRPTADHIAALAVECGAPVAAADGEDNTGISMAAFEGVPPEEYGPVELPVLAQGCSSP